MKKLEFLNLEPNCLIWVYWRAILKNYCPFCNQHSRICLIAKFGVQKKQSLNLGPKIPNLSVFGLKFENTIVIIEIRALEIVLFQSLV